MQEFQDIQALLAQSAGQPLNTELLFNPAIFNVLWSVVAGPRYGYDDPKLIELHYLVVRYVTSNAVKM